MSYSNLLTEQRVMIFGNTKNGEVTRHTIVAVIIEEQTGKYLCQHWQEYGGLTCLLSGGVENSESADEALLREINEETGYDDFTVVGTLGADIESHYVKVDGTKFKKVITPYLITLHSLSGVDAAKEEDEKFDNLFMESNEIIDLMNKYEDTTGSTLGDHKEILNRGVTYLESLSPL